jgi:hypothetical protein
VELRTGTLVLVESMTGTLVLVESMTGTLVLVESMTGTLLLAQFHTLEPIVSTVRPVTGNDKDYLRIIPRVVW